MASPTSACFVPGAVATVSQGAQVASFSVSSKISSCSSTKQSALPTRRSSNVRRSAFFGGDKVFCTPSATSSSIVRVFEVKNIQTPEPVTKAKAASPKQKKLNVGILGCTGSVGQKFIQLLEGHPWFDVTGIGASSRSAGKLYADAANWKQATPVPEEILEKTVTECVPEAFEGVDLVFSGLDAEYAGPIEEAFAKAGIAVFSNAKNHRMDPDVPILIPHANPDHVNIIPHQRKARGYDKGFIVTNANCSTTGMSIVLKPLQDAFGLEKVLVVTMQAISGSGYPGLPSMDILDNVVPFIGGEEGKMETEPLKILASLNKDATGFDSATFGVSAHCNRVHVLDGHTECLSLKFGKSGVRPEEVEEVLRAYTSEAQELGLPSAPAKPIMVMGKQDRPQPRLDRMLGGGYTVSVGRVRPCSLFDMKLTLLSHNTIIGAAGGSIQNAELCIVKGFL